MSATRPPAKDPTVSAVIPPTLMTAVTRPSMWSGVTIWRTVAMLAPAMGLIVPTAPRRTPANTGASGESLMNPMPP